MTFVNQPEGLLATSANANSTSPAVNFNVKAQFNAEIRRFGLAASSIALLEARLRNLFAAPAAPVDLLYRDADNDLITMTSDEELQHAVQLANGLLRVEMRLKGVANAVPAVPETAGMCGKPWKFKHHMMGMGRGFKRGHWGDDSFSKRHHGPFDRSVFEGPFGGRGGFEGPFGGRGGFEGRGGHFGPFGGPRFGPCGPHGFSHDQMDFTEGGKVEKLTARHVKDVTIPDGTRVLPKAPFVKTWRVRNEGLPWPAGTRLLFISHKGDNLGGPEFVLVEGEVPTGGEVDLSVNLVAPEEPGFYTGFWRLCDANGKKFGQRLWCSINVTSNSSSDESGPEAFTGEFDELVQKIDELGLDVPRKKVERLLRKFGGDVNLVAAVLAAKAAHHAKRDKKDWKDKKDKKHHHHHHNDQHNNGGCHKY